MAPAFGRVRSANDPAAKRSVQTSATRFPDTKIAGP